MVAAVNNISLYLLKPSTNHQFNNNTSIVSAGLGRTGLKNSSSEIHALVEQNKMTDGRRPDEEERSLSMDYRPAKVKNSSSNSELEKSPNHPNEQLLAEHRILNITTPV